MLQVNDTALLRAHARFRSDGTPVDLAEPHRFAQMERRRAARRLLLRAGIRALLHALGRLLHPPVDRGGNSPGHRPEAV